MSVGLPLTPDYVGGADIIKSASAGATLQCTSKILVQNKNLKIFSSEDSSLGQSYVNK